MSKSIEGYVVIDECNKNILIYDDVDKTILLARLEGCILTFGSLGNIMSFSLQNKKIKLIIE